MRKISCVIILIMLTLALLSGCQQSPQSQSQDVDSQTTIEVDENGEYDSKEEVSAYLQEFDRLPQNYITKKEARQLGWKGGSLEPYAPGKSIGGDRFGNREKRLPEDDQYRECDIDTKGVDSRGAKRIVYSDDGDIYYTEDHYETFTQLAKGE